MRAEKIRNALLTDQPARGAGWLDTATGVRRPAAAFYPMRHHLRIIWGQAIAAAFDFTPYSKITDLGGATGGHLVGIVERFPHLDAVVFDLEYNQQAADGGLTLTSGSWRTFDSYSDALSTWSCRQRPGTSISDGLCAQIENWWAMAAARAPPDQTPAIIDLSTSSGTSIGTNLSAG